MTQRTDRRAHGWEKTESEAMCSWQKHTHTHTHTHMEHEEQKLD